MHTRIEEAVEQLRRSGWHITARAITDELALSEQVHARYPELDPDHAELLRHTHSCIDRDRLTWILCEPDYNGTTTWPIRWNEWELHAAEIAVGKRDNIDRVQQFWSGHLPVIGTLRSEYTYLVLRLSGDDAGAIFLGRDPEGLELEKVCGCFGDLLAIVARRATGAGPHPGWTDRFF